MLSPKFKKVLNRCILDMASCGQGEGVAIADWLEGMIDEDITSDLIIDSLKELETHAAHVRKELEKVE